MSLNALGVSPKPVPAVYIATEHNAQTTMKLVGASPYENTLQPGLSPHWSIHAMVGGLSLTLRNWCVLVLCPAPSPLH